MTTLKASKGKYKVVGVDTFEGADYLIGEYKSREKAIDVARERAGQMNKTYVYDEEGKEVSSGFGTY